MEQNEVKNPHRMQAIAWRDGAEKEEVVRILNSPEIDKIIPQEMKSYQGKNNAGKRVLWACRQIKMLVEQRRIDLQSSKSEHTEEVNRLKGIVKDLESMLKQAQGGEVSYVDSINHQMVLIRFYRSIIDAMGVTIDEEHLLYKTGKDEIWHVPILK